MTETTTDHREDIAVYRGEKLAELMQRYHVSDMALASVLGIHQTGVNKWRHGQVGWKICNELSVCYYFGAPRSYFWQDGKPSPSTYGSQHGKALLDFAHIREEIIRRDIPSRVQRPNEEKWFADNGLDTSWMRNRKCFRDYPLGVIQQKGPWPPMRPTEPEREPVQTAMDLNNREEEPYRPYVAPSRQRHPLDEIGDFIREAHALQRRHRLSWKVKQDGSLTASVDVEVDNF